MIFIGHKLGQLVIVDLLCADAVSLDLIWLLSCTFEAYLGVYQNKLSLEFELLACRAGTTLLYSVWRRA